MNTNYNNSPNHSQETFWQPVACLSDLPRPFLLHFPTLHQLLLFSASLLFYTGNKSMWMYSLKVITVFSIQQEFTLFTPFALKSPSQQLHTEGGKIFSHLPWTTQICTKCGSPAIKWFSMSLDCSQCHLFISAKGFFEMWHEKAQHSQLYCAEESFLLFSNAWWVPLPWFLSPGWSKGSTCAVCGCAAHGLHRFPGFPTRGQSCVIRVHSQSNN